MARQHHTHRQGLLVLLALAALLHGCGGDTPTMVRIQRALGRDIAEHRAGAGAKPCPRITRFVVAPAVAKCGGQVLLEFVAVTTTGLPLSYAWEIAGQTFETGQQAVWNTPTAHTIGDPEKVYTVRGIVSDGQCAVTQAIDVTVLCVSAFDARVHFEFARAELDGTAQIALDEIGEKLRQNPAHAVLIDGHTDYIGAERANERLGFQRAEAVKAYLQRNWGIDPARILTRSFGSVQPLASNQSDIGRSRNRRAEIYRVILSPDQ